MIDKELRQTVSSASEELTLKKHIHTRAFSRKSRKTLFTSRPSSQRVQEIKKRYFIDKQIHLLAQFFELPEVQALSVDELLACRSADADKSELQHILVHFINGKIDSVHTARQLESFVNKSKPLAWQLWRLFDHWRYQKLETFIDDFKCICLKEVIQKHGAYTGAANIYDESARGLAVDKAAANYNRSDLRVAENNASQEIREHASLFLKTREAKQPEAVKYTKPNNDQVKSFFKSED